MVSSVSNSFILLTSRTVTGITTPSKSEAWSNGNEKYSTFPKVPRLAPYDHIVSFQQSLREDYSTAAVQSAYSTVPTNRAVNNRRLFAQIYGLK